MVGSDLGCGVVGGNENVGESGEVTWSVTHSYGKIIAMISPKYVF